MSRQVDVRALQVARLREEVGALQGVGLGATAGEPISGGRNFGGQNSGGLNFGVEAIDQQVGSLRSCSLRSGRLHEFGGGAALGLTVLLAGRADGDVLWCTRQGQHHDIYPPGLVALGLDPRRLIHARVRTLDDLYWAASEGLRSRAVRLVVVETVRAMTLTVARRLQLAAETGAVPGLILNEDMGEDSLAVCPVATTRWRVGHRPCLGAGELRGRAQEVTWARNIMGGFSIALVRNRLGALGQWQVEWDETAHRLCLVTPAGDGSDYPERSGPGSIGQKEFGQAQDRVA